MSRPARIALLAAGLVILTVSALLLLSLWIGPGGPVIERILIQP
ncbi:MAG: hypothetical protein ABIQ99_03580 [Thermoflexales bacterium]